MRQLTLLFIFISGMLKAQNDSVFVDTKYLEDQLYASISYVKMLNLPEPISQTGFSYGFGFGFIKDFPVNTRRNIALGLGLGYGLNVYYFSVKEYVSAPAPYEDIELKSNKVGMHNVEIPIEIRFRTSTSEKYKFWRVYPGFKFSYAFVENTRLKQREDFDVEKIIAINRFQYGPTLSVGYNKWNLHMYYGFSEIFSNIKNNSYTVGIHDLRLGLIFYIL